MRVANTTVKLVLGIGIVGLAVGCNQVEPEPDEPVDPMEVSLSNDTATLSGLLGTQASNERTLSPDMRVEGLLLPIDVAGFGDQSFAVLDRMEAEVVLFDSAGRRLGSFGREGEGPGEYEQPYAITAFGGDKFVVWDRRGRITVVRSTGSVVETNSEVVGDAPALAQRFPTTRWERPFQLSREDVTRRLRRVGGHRFALSLQRDERFDEEFLASGGPRRFTHSVIVFDSLAQVVDTIFQLPGAELVLLVPPSDISYGRALERPFPQRPMWAAGDGWVVRAHGGQPTATVLFDGGRELVIRWPHDYRPIRDPDLDTYLDWEIEGYRRLSGEHRAEEAAEIPRDLWRDEIRSYQRMPERPQLMGVLGAGPCLGLLGFAPEDSPHGESSRIALINVRRPDDLLYIRVQSDEPGFIRTLERRAIYRIAVREDGTRAVERYPLPRNFCDD